MEGLKRKAAYMAICGQGIRLIGGQGKAASQGRACVKAAFELKFYEVDEG